MRHPNQIFSARDGSHLRAESVQRQECRVGAQNRVLHIDIPEFRKLSNRVVQLGGQLLGRWSGRGAQVGVGGRQRMHRKQIAMVRQKVNVNTIDRFHALQPRGDA